MKSVQVLPWLAIATGVIASPKPPGPSACGAPPDGGHQHPPPPPPPSPSPPSPPGPGPAPGPGRPVVESKKLQELIQEKNIWSTLETLNTIAYANGGNRAFGLPGYAASVDFIFGEVSKLKQFTVWKEDFEALFSQVEKISFVQGDTSYYVTGLTYSPSTTAEGVTAELISAPAGNLSCSVANYANIDVKDKIVLVQRGACPDGSTFAGHVRPAAAAGAAAVIIYNNVETNLTAGTLSNPSPEYVATGGINLADGLALQARLDAGESITATFQQTQAVENRTTQNIFAETKYGDPSNVVMLGGHLDSVQAGPGINDDGSGTALVLELARQMDKFTSTNKLRFAWWGAEENGLLGSKAYCNSLSVDEAEDILTYLNFDMVSQGYYGVFDTDGSKHGVVAPAGSATIEQIFTEHFNANGIETTEAPMTNGTDYASFWKILGKPFGGLSTGTTTDKCYHQSCDSKENVNTTTITNNVKAAAHVMATLAIDGVALLPRPEGGNATQLIARRDTIDWGYDLDALAFLEETGEQHLLTCGHDV